MMKHNNKTFFSDYWAIYLGLVLFIIIKVMHLYRYHFLLWDETVYISMGKYLFSNGSLGYFEIIRPLVLPFFVGLLWKSGIQNPLFLKIAMLPITFISTYLIYKIGKKLYNKSIGILGALIFIGTGTILFYSSSILTGLLATMFMLTSINCYNNKKYVQTGIFAGISILTRFPFGLYLLALGIFILIKLLSSPNKTKKQELFKVGITIAFLAILTTIPFFIFNYFSYHNDVSSIRDAIFRPLLFGTQDVGIKSGFSFDTIMFYIHESISFQPLVFLGIIGLLLEIPSAVSSLYKKQTKEILLFQLITIFFGIFFLFYSIKDIRFSIPMLPFLSIFAALLLNKIICLKLQFIKQTKILFLHLNKKGISKLIQLSPYIFVLIVLVTNSKWVTYEIYDPTPYDVFDFINENNLQGKMLSSEPSIGAYTNIPITVSYYKYNPQTFTLLLFSESYDFLAISSQQFLCEINSSECVTMLPDVLYEINTHYKPIFSADYRYTTITIFETKNKLFNKTIPFNSFNKTVTSKILNVIAKQNGIPEIYS